MSKPLHVAIDARPLSRNSSGIKRYLECLLEEMINADNFRFTLYSDGRISEKYEHAAENVDSRIIPHTSRFSKLLWQYYVYSWLKADKPDLFWSPRHHLPVFTPENTPTVVTIHDVIWKTHPQTMMTSRLLNEKLHMPYSIRRTQQIVCPSQATASKIREYWPDASEKISIIAHGRTEFNQTSDKPSISKPYFLAVGTIEPRKNYRRLIKAFDQWAISNPSHDLVIVGNKAWGWPQVKTELADCACSHRIHLISDANDNDLTGLYKHAAALIQVSLGEGFGMPIAEARQFGLAQVLSDIPVFREIIDDAVIWADPLSIQSIQDSFNKIKQMEPAKPENILQSWAAVCEKMFTVFNHAAGIKQ